jgi:hypothetical protein
LAYDPPFKENANGYYWPDAVLSLASLHGLWRRGIAEFPITLAGLSR